MSYFEDKKKKRREGNPHHGLTVGDPTVHGGHRGMPMVGYLSLLWLEVVEWGMVPSTIRDDQLFWYFLSRLIPL